MNNDELTARIADLRADTSIGDTHMTRGDHARDLLGEAYGDDYHVDDMIWTYHHDFTDCDIPSDLALDLLRMTDAPPIY